MRKDMGAPPKVLVQFLTWACLRIVLRLRENVVTRDRNDVGARLPVRQPHQEAPFRSRVEPEQRASHPPDRRAPFDVLPRSRGPRLTLCQPGDNHGDKRLRCRSHPSRGRARWGRSLRPAQSYKFTRVPQHGQHQLLLGSQHHRLCARGRLSSRARLGLSAGKPEGSRKTVNGVSRHRRRALRELGAARSARRQDEQRDFVLMQSTSERQVGSNVAQEVSLPFPVLPVAENCLPE